jgi:hypothetical protein
VKRKPVLSLMLTVFRVSAKKIWQLATQMKSACWSERASQATKLDLSSQPGRRGTEFESDITAFWRSCASSSSDSAMPRPPRNDSNGSQYIDMTTKPNVYNELCIRRFQDFNDYASLGHIHGLSSFYSSHKRSPAMLAVSARQQPPTYLRCEFRGSGFVPGMFNDESTFSINHALTCISRTSSRATSLRQPLMTPRRRSRTPNVKPVLSSSRTEVSIK